MYLLAIGWLYVALMMAAAEALHPQGSVLGAVFTFLLYGLAPVALMLYLMATPLRRRAQRRAEGTTPQATAHGKDSVAKPGPVAAIAASEDSPPLAVETTQATGGTAALTPDREGR